MRTPRPEEIAVEKGKRRRRGEAEAARSDIIDYVATDSAESQAMRPPISTDETGVGGRFTSRSCHVIRRSGLIGGRIAGRVFSATKESAGVAFARFPCLSFTNQDNLDGLLGT